MCVRKKREKTANNLKVVNEKFNRIIAIRKSKPKIEKRDD
jgi:hypothetical protein